MKTKVLLLLTSAFATHSVLCNEKTELHLLLQQNLQSAVDSFTQIGEKIEQNNPAQGTHPCDHYNASNESEKEDILNFWEARTAATLLHETLECMNQSGTPLDCLCSTKNSLTDDISNDLKRKIETDKTDVTEFKNRLLGIVNAQATEIAQMITKAQK